MRRAGWLLFVAVPFLAVTAARAQHGAGAGQGPGDDRLSAVGREIEALRFDPLTWRVPAVGREVERLVLANGLTVFLYPEHSVPRVGIAVRLRDGGFYEGPGETKEASILTQLLQLGGSTRRSGDEVDALLDRLGARFGISSDAERAAGTLRCLSEDAAVAVDLLADLLRRPALPEDKLAYVRKAERESILRRKDQPDWLATTLIQHELYGDHPFGRIVGLADLDAVARDDLERRHARAYVPERTLIGVAGDFERDAMLALLTAAFGDWARGASTLPAVPLVDPAAAAAPGIYVFHKAIPQSTIRMGHLGVGRGHPDEFALRVMNFILGGQAFKSRLGERVRNDEGLAYAVSSRYEVDTRDTGIFEAYCQTKAASAFRAMGIIREEIERMRAEPPDEARLRQAKEALVNSFVQRWTNPVSTLEQLMDLELAGRPAGYFDTYLERLRAVTAADVARAARDHLHPDRLVAVVIGDSAAMGAPAAGVPLLRATLPPEYMGEAARGEKPPPPHG